MTGYDTKSSERATIGRVNIYPGKAGLLFAKSPDLKGLLVAETTMEDLEREIPIAIAALYEAAGEDVIVFQADDLGDENPVKSWVKVPARPLGHRQYA